GVQTCALPIFSSLMMNSFDAMQRENLTVRNAGGNPNDSYRMEMERNAERLLRRGICPESTNKTFRKPIFLEITYRVSEQVFHLLTAIYDVAGELIRESAGVGRTSIEKHMDGYICLVDHTQKNLEHSYTTKQLHDDEEVLE